MYQNLCIYLSIIPLKVTRGPSGIGMQPPMTNALHSKIIKRLILDPTMTDNDLFDQIFRLIFPDLESSQFLSNSANATEHFYVMRKKHPKCDITSVEFPGSA